MRELVALVLLVVLIFVSCGYTPPENLTKLIEMDGYTLYCPVWSQTGWIYFLAANCLFNDAELYSGSLWVCDTLGGNLRQLLNSKFGYLAVSPNGEKLALTCGKLLEGGPLILVDSNGISIDTIPISQGTATSVRFSADGNKLYYSVGNGDVYRINIDGTEEELVASVLGPEFFDVTPSGRVITMFNPCDLFPIDTNKVVWTYIPEDDYASHELRMRNLLTDIDSSLDVRAYRDVGVCFPYWSPSGRKIVFSVAEDDAGWETHHYGYGELWILDLTK